MSSEMREVVKEMRAGTPCYVAKVGGGRCVNGAECLRCAERLDWADRLERALLARMNANKQDAGGLPEMPEPLWRDTSGLGPGLFTADQMRAYGELCRAATAGGDDARLSNQDGYTVVDCPSCGTCVQFVRKVAETFRPLDSAPAGSGEVALMIAALERDAEQSRGGLAYLAKAAALLRKLQQGAGHG